MLASMTAHRARVISVFGSSRPAEGDAGYGEARALGGALAGAGFVVCSGGYGGVMEAVSRGAKEAGGRTMAVTASVFRTRANRWVDEEIRVGTWEERLFELVRRGEGYVACRGGTGTLVELAVVWEMLNKRVMARKPFAVLGDFWRPVVERVREVEGAGPRWSEGDGELIRACAEPADAARFLGEALGTGI
ncbi:MAG TPA: LOG family protein [Candidatus Acidoferrales bacterium]|nr:LOG family protein [Candidatus Acidoferrales bacterium]